jgi:hypothetical protein
VKKNPYLPYENESGCRRLFGRILGDLNNGSQYFLKKNSSSDDIYTYTQTPLSLEVLLY